MFEFDLELKPDVSTPAYCGFSLNQTTRPMNTDLLPVGTYKIDGGLIRDGENFVTLNLLRDGVEQEAKVPWGAIRNLHLLPRRELITTHSGSFEVCEQEGWRWCSLH